VFLNAPFCEICCNQLVLLSLK